ncbi:MAG: Glu-tRNA(Gln) amidotransferase subunit GatE [Candidatus Nanohaloarchaea archaeon]
MSKYEELGFKCGIEIHQQLDTETKLFCQCPVELSDEQPDANVERFLRAVKGESGESDEAAEVEAEKSKKFVYNYHRKNNCLVELDEEPPHALDEEAMEVALTFARMVDAEIPDEIQVMRKIVVDGSNTSGFQRTAMVGLDGELETSEGSVSIEDIELEEESAGINQRDEEKAVYDLQRLGVPLIEIGTDASIQSPEHAREVAEKLGMLLRSTRKARRGLGTIRQDVNVSIEEGSRVEIKGFQDVHNIDELIEKEVERQENLVELGEEVETGEVEGDNVTHVFEETENELIETVIGNEGAVYALKIPNLDGKMKQKISGDRYVAEELVDYAKARGLRGLIHTDEDIEGYELEEEFEELEEIFNAEKDDVIAILAGPEAQAKNAAQAVQKRAQQLVEGEVPEETRNAEQDFTTSYSRPLPGAARMYPETDIRPIKVTEEQVEEIDENLPETLEEREEELAEKIGEELASQVVYSENFPVFEKFENRVDRKLLANMFTNTLSRLESEGVEVEELGEKDFEAVVSSLEDEEIEKGDIEPVLKEMAEEKAPEEAVEEVVSGKSSKEEIEKAVEEVMEDNSEMVEEQGMRAQGALMGEVMQKVNADGGTVSEILQRKLSERTD